MEASKKLFILIGLFMLFSCKKEDGEMPEDGYNYFPLDVGLYTVFNVVEIDIDAAVSRYDTSRYQLKEKLHSVYTDNTGTPCIRVERYKRVSDSLSWQISDVWYFYRNERNAQKVEENMRYIRLVFPLDPNVIWNGNAMNTLESWDYRYENIGVAATINSLDFPQTLKVNQRFNFNFVEYENCWEMYAPGVGLISKQYVVTDILGGDSTQIQNGKLLFQSISEYGVE